MFREVAQLGGMALAAPRPFTSPYSESWHEVVVGKTLMFRKVGNQFNETEKC